MFPLYLCNLSKLKEVQIRAKREDVLTMRLGWDFFSRSETRLLRHTDRMDDLLTQEEIGEEKERKVVDLHRQ
jgi:hypothetical protein